MKKIRVLHLIEGLSKGGAERRLINDLTFLDKKTFDHCVCTVFNRMDLKEEIAKLRFTIHNLKAKRALDPLAFMRLIKLVRDNHFDIIHTQLFWADFYGRLAGKLCRTKFLISTSQSAVYEPDNSYLYSFKREIVDRILGRYFTTRFVAVSDYVKESMVRRLGIKQEKISVIPNSIDMSSYVPGENEDKEKIEKELSLHKKDIILLTIGRLNPAKGHHFLIEAMDKLKEAFPNLILLVAGDGPSKEELVTLKNRLGLKEQVRFLGERPDIKNLLTASDVFVLPTLSEGLPVSLLEAMAMQKICLASKIKPIKEIIEDGANGFLFEPGNSEDLAQILSHILKMQNGTSQIAKRARENVLQKFDALKTAQALERFYIELTKNN